MKINIKTTTFIFPGLYALLGIYFAKLLIFLYHNGENGINLLPIDYFEILLFIQAILIVIVSVLTFYLLTKKSKIKISRKFKMQLLISILVGSIILFLVVQNSFNQLLIGIMAFVVNNNDWLFLNLTFGVLPILYGVINLKYE